MRLAGAPCWVSVWCGHSAGQPEEGYRFCWHGGPHCALTGELLGWKEIAIGQAALTFTEKYSSCSPNGCVHHAEPPFPVDSFPGTGPQRKLVMS